MDDGETPAHRAEAGAERTILYPPPSGGEQVDEGVAELPTDDPRVWGPFCWTWLHMMAAHYPARPSPAQRRAAAQTLRSLPHMLPCAECRGHCLAWMRGRRAAVRRAPLRRRNLESLLIALHNEVNRRNRKPPMPRPRARALYQTRLVLE